MKKVIFNFKRGRAGGTIIFTNDKTREKAIGMLRKQGFQYFLTFKDVQGSGLQVGHYNPWEVK